MNRKYAGIIVYVFLVLLAGLLVTEYVTASRDNSWIVEVEDFVQKNNWDPDSEYIPLNDWSFFLFENGEEQFFELKHQMDFISYINSLINRINRQVKLSISEEMLDDILANDKVLYLSHRFPTEKGFFGLNYYSAYFILEDNQGTDLEATIITRETNSRNSVWQITKSSIW